MKNFVLSTMVCALLCSAAIFADTDAFPLRKAYPQVTVISTEQLIDQYNNIISIDVRSKLEFDVIHMQGALHVPVARIDFEKNIKRLNENKPIVFYCNGVTCAKSYKAAIRMLNKGYSNVKVYDAGIFAWAKANPQKSVLLSESPVNPEKMISQSHFLNKNISFGKFREMAKSKQAMIVDIREPYQRLHSRATKLDFGDVPVRNFPSDKFLSVIVKPGNFKDRQLLIADAVGKQVRWLQYYLERFGYTNYYFLQGGAKAIEVKS